MRKLTFYLFVLALVIVDSLLISKPNLLGKIGLIIYKYHYLRTFPRTLLTVAIVVAVAIGIAELIELLVKRSVLKRATGSIVLIVLIALSFGILVKTGIDFQAWTYSHTGLRFRFGAYMLPTLLIVIFTFGLLKLPRPQQTFPESPLQPGSSSNNDLPTLP
ncbi:hypothetical protein [Chryseolinea lacunae]|uniref:DUF4293 domain-containing protein n=1 Tax=Chryseolinea lacunae TaxID=2801331 RepID=A0ABS1KTX3_9BACT|nr:hypothetical protein [Chryseolinea lacunae]MBL0742904.1 hypothetical protein [Chryseolinea lacunae]